MLSLRNTLWVRGALIGCAIDPEKAEKPQLYHHRSPTVVLVARWTKLPLTQDCSAFLTGACLGNEIS